MNFKERYTYNTQTDKLGTGGFSIVYKAKDRLLDNMPVALKFFIVRNENKYTVRKEISLAIAFEHPNICRYFGVEILKSNNIHGEIETVEVGIMEYLDGGNIKEYLQKHPKYLDKLLIDVLNGLAYLHQNEIIHRDIKPGNILIKSQGPIAKITDFGISKLMETDINSSSKIVGTLCYMAPEQFEPIRFGIDARVSYNADIWSFGVLAYELITGKQLFVTIDSQGNGEIISRILGENFGEKINALPLKYRALLEKCLVRQATKRCCNCLELITILQNLETYNPELKLESSLNPKQEYIEYPEKVVHNNKAPIEVEKPKPFIKQVAPTKKLKIKKYLAYTGVIIVILIFGLLEVRHNSYKDAAELTISAKKHFFEIKNSYNKKDSSHYIVEVTSFSKLLLKNEIENVDTTTLRQFAISLDYGINDDMDMDKFLTPDYNKVIDYLESGARKEEAECNYILGRINLIGIIGVSQNINKAIAFFEKAAEKGHRYAMTSLGQIFYYGTSNTPKDFYKAKEYYEKGSERGVAAAIYDLGIMYFEGTIATPQDYYKAKSYFEKAINMGYIIANYELAVMYSNGTPATPENNFKAKEFAEKAAEAKNTSALYLLGSMYYFGTDANPRDFFKAKEYYEKGAKKNNGKALMGLSTMYFNGTPATPQNSALAKEYALKANENGDTYSLCGLGIMYASGTDATPKNYYTAKDYFEKAIAKGDLDGMYNLGMLYKMGTPATPKDLAKANELLGKACKSGLKEACDNLNN